jgi:hypothetical protein
MGPYKPTPLQLEKQRITKMVPKTVEEQMKAGKIKVYK